MNKNDQQLQVKVHSAMYTLIKEKGIASPAEVFITIGALSTEDYERWRFGKVDYLERVCKINLRKLSFVNHEIRAYARKHDLKPSWTFYKRWGTNRKSNPGNTVKLRFSKSGDENIENQYATHYVGQQKITEAKERRKARQLEAEPDVTNHNAVADTGAKCRACRGDMRTASGCQPFLYKAGGKNTPASRLATLTICTRVLARIFVVRIAAQNTVMLITSAVTAKGALSVASSF